MNDLCRRTMLGAAFAAASAMTSAADACTIVVRRKPQSFSRHLAERSVRDLVALINDAPKLSESALADRADAYEFDDGIATDLDYYPTVGPIERTNLLREWGRSDGKPDNAPIRLTELTLLKEAKGVALYQFALTRSRYHAEVEDDCFGLSPAGYTTDTHAYLAVLLNNKVRNVRPFRDWLQAL